MTAPAPDLVELAKPFSSNPNVNREFIMKGHALRGVIRALETTGELVEVRRRVPSPILRYIDHPPLPSAWMPAIVFQFVFSALEPYGEGFIRQLGRDSIMNGPIKYARPIVEGTLRLFGASPMAFFERTPSIMTNSIRGVRFDCESRGVDQVRMTVVYEHLHDVSDVSFAYWQGTLGITLELCGKTLVEHRMLRSDQPPRNEAGLLIAWS